MLENILNRIKNLPAQTEESLNDALGLIVQMEDREELLRWVRWVRSEARKMQTGEGLEIVRKTYFLAARRGSLDDYCIALEWNRSPEKRFYLPRRAVLKPLVDDLQDLLDGKLDFLGVSLPPRVGKQLSDDTPVLTRGGWKNHGDLVVGDEVIGLDGEFKRVTYVFPKAKQDCRVWFSNGEHIDCHENHEWVVYDRHKQRERVVETKEFFEAPLEEGDRGKRGHRYHYMLPLREPVRGEYKNLRVPPYTLGAWLGDGTNKNPRITGSPDDWCVIEGVVADGYEIRSTWIHKDTGCHTVDFDKLRFDLQHYGMCHSRRRVPKYIPEEYLTATVEQRLNLLAGLLDTDGCLVDRGRYQFSTTEETLRDSFVALVNTFGWRVSVTEQAPHTSSFGIEGRKPCWVIGFNPTMEIPCRCERKRNEYIAKQRRVSVVGVERVTPTQGNCIEVEGGIYLAGRAMIPTHNSTLCIFFMTLVMGLRPEVANVMSGHSDKLTDGFYRELLSIITDDTQYCWKEIFPDVKIVDNSAKNETIDLARKKRFPTMTCRSISGTLTGAVEIGTGGILYCDDLIEDLEESLNPVRLQNKYDAYLNQLKDRKKLGALELMVGTRWNVADPLGRIEEQYRDNPRYRFRVIPALDENGESNFNYKYDLGFDTAYYEDMKESIDDATWMAKYMGNPYIREGLLFPADELRYYNGVLPDGVDRKAAVVDTAWGGGDSLSMPVAYIFGEDVYIHDVVFNSGDKTVTRPLVLGKLKAHEPHMVRWESNNGGDEYGGIVDESLRKDGVKINMSYAKAPTNQSKMSRIIQFAPDIKRFYFLDEKHRSPEYEKFMRELTLFTVNKNPHDDAADSLAMLVDFLSHGVKTVSVMKRPF